MFGLGGFEFAIIVGVILVVLGPTLIPRLGKRMGDTMFAFRQAADELQSGMAESGEGAEPDKDKDPIADGPKPADP